MLLPSSDLVKLHGSQYNPGNYLYGVILSPTAKNKAILCGCFALSTVLSAHDAETMYPVVLPSRQQKR